MGTQPHRSNYGHILFNEELRLVGVNDFVIADTGVDVEECRGRLLSEIFPSLNIARLKDMLARLGDIDGVPVIDRATEPTLWTDLFTSDSSAPVAHQLSLLSKLSGPDNRSWFSLLLLHREVLDHFYEQSLVDQAVANQRMLQSEKLAAIGQLAAGVAHEINNPLGFVFSNLKTLGEYVSDLIRIVDDVETATDLDSLRELKRRLDYDYIRSDVGSLLIESEDGIDRVKTIIGALKDFSHIGEEEFRVVDIHRGLDTTLSVVNNELKYKAEIIKNYGDTPHVECIASQINQVAMNLLVNAAHAIENFGKITISTGGDDEWVWFDIQDTGKGIEPRLLNRIFEPFFTTKPVGNGTGLGLALSYNIIEKHHGRIEVNSQVGVGTNFRVWLPVAQPANKSQVEF